MLWRTAGLYEWNRDLRQELYQEILLAVWKALPRFRSEANLRTYLARIAHNRGVTHVNLQVKQPPRLPLEDEMASPTPTPLQEAEADAAREQLIAAIRSLPIPTQQVLTLSFEGFKPREIADVLGVSANVVSIRLSRARQALRESREEESI